MNGLGMRGLVLLRMSGLGSVWAMKLRRCDLALCP